MDAAEVAPLLAVSDGLGLVSLIPGGGQVVVDPAAASLWNLSSGQALVVDLRIGDDRDG